MSPMLCPSTKTNPTGIAPTTSASWFTKSITTPLSTIKVLSRGTQIESLVLHLLSYGAIHHGWALHT
jgi:hypothetical protein